MLTSSRLDPARAVGLSAQTPFVLYDVDVVGERIAQLQRALPGVTVHYAVKCNGAAPLLREVVRAGAGFEIASAPELAAAEAAGVRPADVLYSNPVKPPAHIRATFAAGVHRFAADSEEEVRKLAEVAPGAAVYVRIAVDDRTSIFPLSKKFGVTVAEAARLLVLARHLGLVPYGVTFHVGSQCNDPGAWARALGDVATLMRTLRGAGITLTMVDLGGGFPVRYVTDVPTVDEIGRATLPALASLPYQPDVLVVEPGRYVAAPTGVMVASVIGLTRRDGARWVHLDVGGYNGLMETVQAGGRWPFPLWTTATGTALERCTVTGPSCDSSDTMFSDVLLPADLAVDDRVVIGCAGAYTLSYASSFNGFPPPIELYAGALRVVVP